MESTEATAEKLFKKHNTAYLFRLYNHLKKGVDIKTAIWLCYNELECGGTNG